MATAHVWYRLLNCGFRLPAGAGTDAMTNFASLRGPVGMNRVYVQTGGRARPAAAARLAQGRADLRHQRPAARASRSTGAGSASELRLAAGAHELRGAACRSARTCRSIISRSWATARSSGRSRSPATARRADVDGAGCRCRASGWFLLRARSDRAIEPVLDLYPYATTSPIYVTVGGGAGPLGGGRGLLPALDRPAGRGGAGEHATGIPRRSGTTRWTRSARARAEFERRRGETRDGYAAHRAKRGLSHPFGTAVELRSAPRSHRSAIPLDPRCTVAASPSAPHARTARARAS